MLIDFSKVPDYIEQKFEPLPEGTYKTMLFSITLGKSKNNDDMLILGYKVLNDPTTMTDRIIKDYILFNNDLGLSKLKNLLQKSNIDINQQINITDLIADGSLLGLKYNMNITVNDYTNKYGKQVQGNRIKNFAD